MKKRFIAVLLVLVMVIPVVAVAATYYHVSTTRVESHYLPEEGATVLDSYRRDWALTLVKKYGSWWRVKFTNGEEGYIQSKYVTKSRSYNAWITQDDTELRTGPDYSFNSVYTLQRGDKVAVRSHGSNYDYVTYKTYSGYVRNSFLSKKRVAATKKQSGTKAYTAYITSENGRSVNVRNGGGENYGIIGSFKPGTAVTVESSGKTWSLVVANGLKGWVMSKYITKTKPDVPEPIATSTPVVCPYYAYVVSPDGEYVNVHRGKGDGYANATTASVGTVVVVLEHGLTWDKIRIDSQNSVVGWIKNEFLSQTPPTVAGDPSTIPTPVPSTTIRYIVSENGKSVNMRRGPGLGYSLVDSFPIGTQVTLISRGSKWSSVEVNGKRGYIKNDFLSSVSPNPTPTPVPLPGDNPTAVPPATAVPATETATVWSDNGGAVHVHKGPGTGYSDVTKVMPGTTVLIIQYVSSKWVKIQLEDGREGYIMSDYLQ